MQAAAVIAIICMTWAIAAPEVRFERLGPYGGTVRSLLMSSGNSQVVYLGTSDGQLFKSADGGSSWGLLYPGIDRRQIVIDSLVEDPADAAHLYAGGWALRSDGGGLFESRDAGKSWNRVALPKPDVAIRGFAICRGNAAHMIVGTGAGVFLSVNGGRSWERAGAAIAAFLQTESVAIDPKDPRILFVGTWHLGYRSNDSGRTWVLIDKGMIPDSDIFSISIDPRDPRNIFASTCTGLYRSIDRGSSWTRLRVFPKSYLVRAQIVTMDPTDSSRVYGGTTEGLFASRNSGKSWDRITAPDLAIHALQIDPANANRIILGTESHGVLRSEDGGRSWTVSNRGFVSRSITRVAADQNTSGRLFVGEYSEGQLGGFYMYDHAINDWLRVSRNEAPGEGMLSLLALPGKRGRIAGTARGAFVQRPGVKVWSRLPGPIGKLAVYDLAISRDHAWLFAGTNDGIYRARLDDLSFQKPTGYNLIPRVFCLLISGEGSGPVLAGTHMGLLRSENAGTSWSIVSSGIPDHTIIECLASSPASESHVFAGTTAGLYESRDGGRDWQSVADGRLGVNIASVIFLDASGNRILAGDYTHGGVFLSQDAGGHWERIYHPEYGAPVRSMAMDPANPSVVYLGTSSEGVYRLSLQPFERK